MVRKVRRPPIVELEIPDPLQEWYSDGTGALWSVARLVDYTKDLPVFDCPLAALDLGACVWNGSDMMSLAFHWVKVNMADLSKPIIIAWDGGVADGRHRIIKALTLGKRTVKAVRMQERIIPDRTAEE